MLYTIISTVLTENNAVIKQNKLNTDCTEIIFNRNIDEDSNKFQDRVEMLIKKISKKLRKHPVNLYQWTENKITYLITKPQEIASVNYKNFTPRSISAKVLHELEDSAE